MATEMNVEAERMENYSPEDRAFFDFWYGHMLSDLMQPPLCSVDHSTARYIWDAGRRAAQPADVEAMILPAQPSAAPSALVQTFNKPSRIDAYVRELAMSLWRTHYRTTSPKFELLDDTHGVLTQIDNMITGLVLAAPTSDQQAGARLDGLVRYTGKEIATIYSFEDEEFFEVADVERILAAPAAIEQAGAQPVAQGWNIERNDTPEVRRFIINNGRNYRSITEDDEPTLFRYFATLAAPTPATDQDALDAKRYRWLRAQPFDTWKRIGWNTWGDDPAVFPIRDEDIDSAMAATPVTDQDATKQGKN